MTLDLLEEILLAVVFIIPLHFKHFFYKFPLFSCLDQNMSFVEAARAPWEWEEGSYQEKVSLFYSLHPLDFLHINF